MMTGRTFPLSLFCCVLLVSHVDAQKSSFVSFRLGGPVINGDVHIIEDGDYRTQDVRATLIPKTESNPEVIQLSYSESGTEKIFSINLTTVPQSGPYSVEKGSPYSLSVHDGTRRYSMAPGLISVHITKLKRGKTYAFGSLGIKEIEANFTGKLLYIDLNNQNAEPVEHFIDGNLYYKSRI